MRRIKILETFTRVDSGTFLRDREYDVSDEVAKEAISAGHAEAASPIDKAVKALYELNAGVFVSSHSPPELISAANAIGIPVAEATEEEQPAFDELVEKKRQAEADEIQTGINDEQRLVFDAEKEAESAEKAFNAQQAQDDDPATPADPTVEAVQ